MEDNNERGNPHVTLILKKERFKVEKQKLMDKSQYFAALLSSNYREYGQKEHVINYDISPILLQDFIDWIHDNKIASSSATSYEELDSLLNLLELSVLFAADNLVEDITDRLERHFMSPEYAINIWLQAKELNINVLRDLSLAVCLDRFDELPIDSICELSEKNFLMLIGNINVRSTMSYLFKIRREWEDYHHACTVPSELLKNKKAKTVHGIISCEYNNREQFIHCWDGNDFFELTSFEYPADIIEHCCSTGKNLEGMQITARRHDLYLCGGEYGIGSGRFNKNVWRYSLISRKWFLETVMPDARRHMITGFLKDKLLLVGGVGRYRQKLLTVHIYNIFTGAWTSGTETPLQFTSVPKHFIFDDNLIISEYVPTIYIYFPDRDAWVTKYWECPKFNPANIPILTLETMPCYIDIVDQDKIVLRTVTETCNVEGCDNVEKSISEFCSMNGEEKYIRNLQFIYISKCDIFNFVLTPFFHGCSIDNKSAVTVLLCTDYYGKRDLKMLHLHNIPIRNSRKFHSLFSTMNSTRTFLNLIHPAHLHTTNCDYV